MAGRLAHSALAAVVCLSAGCASRAAEPTETAPRPVPTVALAGRTVVLYPLTMIVSERDLGWDSLLDPRAEALARSDSFLEQAMTERATEIVWVFPEALRRAARQAPGMFPNPDQMGTAVLRNPGFSRVPDPLRSQLRLLTGATGDRLAMIPTSLVFLTDKTDASGGGRAELTLVLADVRTGDVTWRSTARAVGNDPWDALDRALETILPIIP